MRTYTQAEVDAISDSQYRLGVHHAEAKYRLDGIQQNIHVLAEDMERQCATLHDHASKAVAPTSQSVGVMVQGVSNIRGYETRVATNSPGARHTVIRHTGHRGRLVSATSAVWHRLRHVTTWFH